MDKESSEMLGKENKKTVRKGKKVLKVISLCCAGLIGIFFLAVVGYIIYEKYNPIYTDFDGNFWQKYEGDKSTPTFTVFAEQSGVDKDKKPVSKINISSGCDPKNLSSNSLEGDFAKGVERPNHCIISNTATAPYTAPSIGASSPFSDNSDLDYYLLFSDGSLISLDGAVANKIQVNVNSDSINIIQSEGTAYYHIQKQADGKKFTIDMGPETFTAIGTDLLFKTDGATASLRNYQMAVLKGSGQVKYRKISTLGNRILERVTRKKQSVPDEFPLKEKQKISYAYHKDIPPTITPINMADTDTLMTNKFVLKQYSRIFVVIYIKGVSFDLIKSALQEILVTIQKANQLAVELSEKQNASTTTFDPTDCSAIPDHHAEADGTCCPTGQSLWPEMGSGCWLDSRIAADKKNSSSNSSASGSSSTGDSCPPSSIPRPTSCQSNSMNSDGKCWCDYEGNEGWWSPNCLPSGVTCN